MSVFERLLCLDSELIVLGTRMFIAKEEVKNAIRYSKSSNISYKDDEEYEETLIEEVGGEEDNNKKEWSYYERMKQKAEMIFAENRARNEREERERLQRLSELKSEEA